MDKLPFNWFDLVVVAALIFGGFHGRKRGMSQELMPMLKWIFIVIGCAFAYKPIADFIASTWFSRLFSSYAAFLLVALIISILFSLVNKSIGGKIVGSDVFGKGEYYLGIFAGIVHFACILIFAMALLNARLFTAKEIEDRRIYVQKNLDNDFFPALYQIQDAVFKESISGPPVRDNLSFLLIKPVVAENKELKRNEFNLPM